MVDELRPAAIWLFGSRATGRHRPDSDFDLLVVARDQDGEAGRDYDRAYAPIVGLGVGVDVVPCTEQDFVEERISGTSLISEVIRTGRQIYGAALIGPTSDDGMNENSGN
ncbi:putative nucleotidyltransferase [Devosia sp. UYZn731]|uniref:nucleotidyltransferase domain-containing protein n=1 Tax=Devosia sp. UYZn731 TaxID=3156345 RepID=UPI00339AE421